MKLKTLTFIASMVLIILFTGCNTVNRGTLPQMSLGQLASYKNSYDVIDTSKEDIGTPKPPVSVVERFEVVDGGCTGQDCGKLRNNGNYGDRERIELKVPPQNRDTGIGEYWYTWSIYFPEDYVSITPAQSCYGQFHSKGGGPYYMFVDNDGYRIKKEGGVYSKPLIEDKDLRGKWHTIKIQAVWSSEREKGMFKVWVNNGLKYSFEGPLYTRGQPYFKYGIYRTYVTQYKSAQVVEKVQSMKDSDLTYRDKFIKATESVKVPTQVVYYSNVKRSSTREGLKP